MKKILAFLIIPFLLSCSSVRLRYDAEFKTDSGKKGDFVMEKSYPVGSVKTWCILTFWLYGGGCWWYIGLPSDDQLEMVNRDAELRMKTQAYSNKLFVLEHKITRISWEDEAPNYQISGQTTTRLGKENPHGGPTEDR